MASFARWRRASATTGIAVLWALAMLAMLWGFLFSLPVLLGITEAIPIAVGLFAFAAACLFGVRRLSPFADKPASGERTSAPRTSAQDVAGEAVPEASRQDE